MRPKNDQPGHLAVTVALTRAKGNTLTIDGAAPPAAEKPAAFAQWLAAAMIGGTARTVHISGLTGSRNVLRTLGLLRLRLADTADILVAEADFAAVYEALVDVVSVNPEFRFYALHIQPTPSDRPGRGHAVLEFVRGRADLQDPASIPINKNKALRSGDFSEPAEVLSLSSATRRVEEALATWHAGAAADAAARKAATEAEFPDSVPPHQYWHNAALENFTGFFTWGHDHNFGFNHVRRGAMGRRHVEIVSEALSLGMLPLDLHGVDVLDVGCWTGGDALALAGLGANVIAIDEHPVSACAALYLCRAAGAEVEVLRHSLYDDRADWAQRFDVVYCSGVVYHVTDPLLFLRICFAYLKPGGRLVLETKAETGEDAACAYAGTRDKGWNWYSPTRPALGRWLADTGFPVEAVAIHWRPIGRLLAVATKPARAALPESAGFSRPGSWLEGEV